MQEWNPGNLLGMSGYYWRTCALHAAVKLDIFTSLGEERLGADEVANRTATDPDGCQRLLTVLTAMELIIKDGDAYSNSLAALRWLSKDSPTYMGFMILHHHYLMESWSRLDRSVATGKPVRERGSFSEETREAFLMGMFNNAMLQAPGLVPHIDLSGCTRLLDMGGGPGTYAIHFCQANPELKAVVFDLPTTLPFAEKTIESFGLTGRIEFQPGDYTAGALSGSYDVVWMSHILHGEGNATCHEMVKKAADVLEPGGRVFIHEFILNDDGTGPLFPALFSLNMLTGTGLGRAYTESEITDMMLASGLSDIELLDYRGPTDSAILVGTR